MPDPVESARRASLLLSPLPPPDTDTLATRAELEAVADNVLGPDTPARKAWTALHDPKAPEYRNGSLIAILRQAGFPRAGTLNATRIVNAIFGKMERAGCSRAYSLNVMAGLRADRVKACLARLIDQAEDRTAVRAADVASKVLGMQQHAQGTRGAINVYAPNATTVNVDARALTLSADLDD